jgi:Rad3-related DNA helicase
LSRKIILSEEECFQPFSRTEPKPYQRDIINELRIELAQGKDVALQLPTGTGKTFIYLPVAKAAAAKDYRVAILAATNLIVDQISDKYLPYFKKDPRAYIVKGIEHYPCLITSNYANYTTCTIEQRTECETTNPNCEVIRTNKQLEEYGLILTNFHKFLSVRTEKGFDLVIIDDSHGFENALSDKFQTNISYYQIEKIYQEHESKKDILSDFTGNFLDSFDEAFITVPPEDLNRKIPDDIVKEISEIEGVEDIWNQMPSLSAFEQSVCYNLLYFVECCKKTSLNMFYIQKDYYRRDKSEEANLIVRKSEAYQKQIIKSLFGNSAVLFASATPGDIVTHARNCTHRNYLEDDVTIIPRVRPPIVDNWFKNLKIYEIQDLPDDPIENGTEIAAKIINKTKGKVLLLFKSYRDQKRAQYFLKKVVSRRIVFIDESYQNELVQDLVESADIIMATASSRLWEGIDISNLTLEIIFSLPFIRPPVYLDPKKSFPFNKRKMLIRLQQGIGRLIRNENDRGICVILDSKLRKYEGSKNFSQHYRDRIFPVSVNNLIEKIEADLWGK